MILLNSWFSWEVTVDSDGCFSSFVVGDVGIACLYFIAFLVLQLLVLAVDEGEPPLTATAQLTVTLLDVNDHAPSLLKDYTPVVLENSAPRVVVELFAHDLDDHNEGHGPPYTFSLDSDVDSTVARLFRVQTNQSECQIRFTQCKCFKNLFRRYIGFWLKPEIKTNGLTGFGMYQKQLFIWFM